MRGGGQSGKGESVRERDLPSLSREALKGRILNDRMTRELKMNDANKIEQCLEVQ